MDFFFFKSISFPLNPKSPSSEQMLVVPLRYYPLSSTVHAAAIGLAPSLASHCHKSLSCWGKNDAVVSELL